MKKQNDSRLPGLEMPVNPPVAELEVVSPNIALVIASVIAVIIATGV
jgi:hypothetical protein